MHWCTYLVLRTAHLARCSGRSSCSERGELNTHISTLSTKVLVLQKLQVLMSNEQGLLSAEVGKRRKGKGKGNGCPPRIVVSGRVAPGTSSKPDCGGIVAPARYTRKFSSSEPLLEITASGVLEYQHHCYWCLFNQEDSLFSPYQVRDALRASTSPHGNSPLKLRLNHQYISLDRRINNTIWFTTTIVSNTRFR